MAVLHLKYHHVVLEDAERVPVILDNSGHVSDKRGDYKFPCQHHERNQRHFQHRPGIDVTETGRRYDRRHEVQAAYIVVATYESSLCNVIRYW